MNIGEYWDKKILEWENSMHGNKGISPIELAASLFRKPLRFRSNIALNLLLPHVKDKEVVELGCGSGFFAFQLCELGHPKHFTAIDISEQAVKRAKSMAVSKGTLGSVTFLQGDASNSAFPDCDIIIGLGFLDYLNLDEIRSIFRKIRSKFFLFTFSEKKISLLRYMHILYLLSQSCPKHFYYTKDDIRKCIGERHGEIHFLNHKDISFGCVVHNLPV